MPATIKGDPDSALAAGEDTAMDAVNILGAVGWLGLIAWVAWDMPPAVEHQGGSITLRYSRWVRCYFLFAAFGIPLGFTVVAIFKPPENDGDLWAIAGLYALFGVLSLPFWWETIHFSLTISATGLECRSGWRGVRRAAWTDVASLFASEFGRWFLLRTHSGPVIRVPSQFMPGLSCFLEAVEKHAPLDRPEGH
jgi:hypothetical protein